MWFWVHCASSLLSYRRPTCLFAESCFFVHTAAQHKHGSPADVDCRPRRVLLFLWWICTQTPWQLSDAVFKFSICSVGTLKDLKVLEHLYRWPTDEAIKMPACSTLHRCPRACCSLRIWVLAVGGLTCLQSALCEALLAANWSPQQLPLLVVLGNSFRTYQERWAPLGAKPSVTRPNKLLLLAARGEQIDCILLMQA